MIRIIKIFILLSFSQLAYSQDLQKDSIFFQKQAMEYQYWLSGAGFSKILKYKNMEMLSDKVILRFELKSGLDWMGLKKSYNDSNPNSVSELLFSRMIHLFEVPQENAEISLSDHKNYYVNISYKNNKLLVVEPNPKGLVSNNLIIPIVKINKLKTECTQDVVENNVDIVKNIIENYLRSVYENKTARFSQAKVNIWQDDNTVYAKISNITKEIIYDSFIGYWELIDYVIKVEQVDNNVKIYYTLQGKYGAGIFVAPRQNDFVDMERDYKNYLDTYNEQLKSKIRKELLKHR
jgi:hypothetical protein